MSGVAELERILNKLKEKVRARAPLSNVETSIRDWLAEGRSVEMPPLSSSTMIEPRGDRKKFAKYDRARRERMKEIVSYETYALKEFLKRQEVVDRTMRALDRPIDFAPHREMWTRHIENVRTRALRPIEARLRLLARGTRDHDASDLNVSDRYRYMLTRRDVGGELRGGGADALDPVRMELERVNREIESARLTADAMRAETPESAYERNIVRRRIEETQRRILTLDERRKALLVRLATDMRATDEERLGGGGTNSEIDLLRRLRNASLYEEGKRDHVNFTAWRMRDAMEREFVRFEESSRARRDVYMRRVRSDEMNRFETNVRERRRVHEDLLAAIDRDLREIAPDASRAKHWDDLERYKRETARRGVLRSLMKKTTSRKSSA